MYKTKGRPFFTTGGLMGLRNNTSACKCTAQHSQLYLKPTYNNASDTITTTLILNEERKQDEPHNYSY